MSVFLSNLDDFIAPSQACINPLITKSSSSSSTTDTKKLAITLDNTQSEYEFTSNKKPNLIRTKDSSINTSKKVASVSLNDCLACRYSQTICSQQ